MLNAKNLKIKQTRAATKARRKILNPPGEPRHQSAEGETAWQHIVRLLPKSFSLKQEAPVLQPGVAHNMVFKAYSRHTTSLAPRNYLENGGFLNVRFEFQKVKDALQHQAS